MKPHELNALHIALMHAKFPLPDKQEELAFSPIIVDLLAHVRKKLEVTHVFHLKDYPDAYEIVRRRLADCNIFEHPYALRREMLDTLVYPFIIDETEIDELIGKEED